MPLVSLAEVKGKTFDYVIVGELIEVLAIDLRRLTYC